MCSLFPEKISEIYHRPSVSKSVSKFVSKFVPKSVSKSGYPTRSPALEHARKVAYQIVKICILTFEKLCKTQL